MIHHGLRRMDATDQWECLRTLRKQKDLSQAELWQRNGLHYTHISRFEHSASRSSGDIPKRLADALDATGGVMDEAAHANLLIATC